MEQEGVFTKVSGPKFSSCWLAVSLLPQVSLKCRAPEVSQCVFQSYEAILKNWVESPLSWSQPLPSETASLSFTWATVCSRQWRSGVQPLQLRLLCVNQLVPVLFLCLLISDCLMWSISEASVSCSACLFLGSLCIRLLNHSVSKLENTASAVIVNIWFRLDGFGSIRKLPLRLSEAEGVCVIPTQIFKKYIFLSSVCGCLLSCVKAGEGCGILLSACLFVSRLLSVHQICRRLIKWQLCLLSYWSHSSTSFLFVLLACVRSLRCGVVLSPVHRPSVCVPRQRPVATSQAFPPGQIRAACPFSNQFLLFL